MCQDFVIIRSCFLLPRTSQALLGVDLRPETLENLNQGSDRCGKMYFGRGSGSAICWVDQLSWPDAGRICSERATKNLNNCCLNLMTYGIDDQATSAIGANSLLLDDFLLIGKVEQLRTMSTVRLASHRFSFAFEQKSGNNFLRKKITFKSDQ